jgi:hypothetical protein
MRRAPAKPPRSTSTSRGRGIRGRFGRSLPLWFAVALALLTGGLLAGALPALAGPGVRRAATGVTGTATLLATSGAVGTAGPTTAALTQDRDLTSTLAVNSPPEAAGSDGRWNRPFGVLAPIASDLIAPLITVSAANAIAVGSGPTDEDAPASARAEVLTAGADDRFAKALAPASAQATLAAAYLGPRLVLLTGTSASDDACCSSASAQVVDAGTLATPVPLAGGLEGATAAVLVPVRGGLLAAVDNQAGITVGRSDATGNFSGIEQIVTAHPTPPLMAAGPLSDGGALIAFTAPASAAQKVTGTTTSPGSSSTASGYDQPRNRLIEYATAGPSGSPGAVKLAVTVPAGRQIDALTVMPLGSGVTLGWTESWYVGNRYLSQVFSDDLSSSGTGPQRTISAAASDAVGLSGAGSAAGGEVLSWQACDIGAGTCETEAVLRPPGGDWGAVLSLGSVDPTSFPVAAQSPAGQSVIGWITHGVVEGAVAESGASGFLPAVRVSRASDASVLALSFGAGTRAAAVWVQGTDVQKLVGARFTP